ncbi:MAG: RAD55 family ATPase [Bacteroidota bacterium]|nr:RAD55 family ATPase [Bacteroidota bacterium]
MKKKIEILPTGITLVDSAWGGFYNGGTYLLVGAHKTGRTLLSLQFALECTKQKEVCLYFTNMRPKDLMIQAASIDFDLQSYMNENKIIVVKVAPPSEIYDVENPDDFLADYLNDIVTVVDQYQPSKIIFDELTPFIGFQNIQLLENQFRRTTEIIEDNGITSLFVVGDPVTPAAKNLVDTLVNSATGVLYLQKDSDDSKHGKMIITPNVGHTEGKFSAEYSIEPYKGIVVEIEANKYGVQPGEHHEIVPSVHSSFSTNSKYKSLSSIDTLQDQFHFTNIYDYNEFNLILNNQIALFNSTGQIFNIVSVKLDDNAEESGLIILKQLQNVVRLSTDKKDKICFIDNKIVVLISKDDDNLMVNLASKIKSNLPVLGENDINNISKFIGLFIIKINSNIKNSEDVFEIINENEKQETLN